MSRFDMDVRCSTFDVQTRMTNDLSAEEVRALLKLVPHVFRRDAETSTQDACATQKGKLNARQLTR